MQTTLRAKRVHACSFTHDACMLHKLCQQVWTMGRTFILITQFFTLKRKWLMPEAILYMKLPPKFAVLYANVFDGCAACLGNMNEL